MVRRLTDAVGRASTGNTRELEASLYRPAAVWAFLKINTYFSVFNIYFYTADSKGSPPSSEVAVHTHVNIARLACNYYSKVKEWIDPQRSVKGRSKGSGGGSDQKC